MSIRSIIFLLSLFFHNASFAQVDTLRIASYNLLKFPSANGNGRLEHFKTVIRNLQPDILVVQELESQAALLTLLNEVMNKSGASYFAAPFSDGPDTDNGLFLKSGKADLLAPPNQIRTSVRQISEYFILTAVGDFVMYSVHLKAGSTGNDQQRRLTDATILRDHLNAHPPNTDFMVVGDFNIRASGEDAYLVLTGEQANNNGRLFDPIDKPGTWHNNSFFTLTHTQSTRTSQFGDGASGGLDDRFDQILVSSSFLTPGGMDIIKDTYKAFGNDGNKFNDDINSGTNLAVPDSVADALHFASDHLPVVVDFIVGNVSSVNSPPLPPQAFTLHQNFPNPFNPTTKIRFSTSSPTRVRLRIFDLNGHEVTILLDDFVQAGEHEVEFDAGSFASGIYFYKLESEGKQSDIKKMLFLK